jgi:hypothetical protein
VLGTEAVNNVIAKLEQIEEKDIAFRRIFDYNISWDNFLFDLL